MICQNCQATNRQEARFCKRCGVWLAPNCPFCQAALPEMVVFCDQCGRQVNHPALLNLLPPAAPAQSAPAQPLATQPAQIAQPSRPQPVSPKTAGATGQEADGSQLQRFISDDLKKKLEHARASGDMVGERRIVSMMFCDVKGSTAAADQLDPEEWSEIINGAFEHMIKPVYKYEGTVARLMGDGILAFFGAPIAHEDDPQRAVLAGLDIVNSLVPYREQVQQTWGIDLNMRIGINTGLVVVGAVGSDLRMEYTALGDAINLASRMEQTAAPGTVQIAQDTYKLVKTLFEFEDLGGIEVKGKAEPVPAYRVLARKSVARRERGIEGLHAEMVGRQAEMGELTSVMEDLKQGVGRIVNVLGEAGLGKSRLISESQQVFQELIGLDGNWYETLSLSYEFNQAYGLIQRLIKRVNGIAYNDPPQVVREKLAVMIESFEPEQRSRVNQIIETLFGFESGNGNQVLEGETFKRELLESMFTWWRKQFSERPTVLVFDDMHWGDAASLELLKNLLSLTGEIPLVLLCAMREERQTPAWQIKSIIDDLYRHRYTELSLRPLSDEESNELLNRLLENPDLPDELRASILEKSGGNPFFIEEVVRTLIDKGAVVCEEKLIDGEIRDFWSATSEGADFAIPDNLQSLLSARMDQLEEATRSTLQMASVIGRSFYHKVLQAMNDDSPELNKHVSTLLQLDMIRESARVPEVEYMFRNPLTQEAVYETILLKRRRKFHLRVGDAMENLYPDRLEGLYGLLAHHFALAGQRDKAVAYCRQASRQAVAVYAYDEAAQNLRTALKLIPPGENSEIHMALKEELGDVCRLVRDFNEAITFYQQALEIWEALEAADQIIPVRLHRKIIQIANEAKWSVEAEAYRQVSQASNASIASLEDRMVSLVRGKPHWESVHLLVALSVDAWRNQEPPDWELAQNYAQTAVDMAEEIGEELLLSRALGALANVLDGRSLLRRHLEIAQRRLQISQADISADPREQIDTQRGVGLALMYVGEYAQALPYLEQAEDLAEKIQAADQVANALGIQAQCLFRMDRWDEVLSTEVKWRELEAQHVRERVGET